MFTISTTKHRFIIIILSLVLTVLSFTLLASTIHTTFLSCFFAPLYISLQALPTSHALFPLHLVSCTHRTPECHLAPHYEICLLPPFLNHVTMFSVAIHLILRPIRATFFIWGCSCPNHTYHKGQVKTLYNASGERSVVFSG